MTVREAYLKWSTPLIGTNVGNAHALAERAFGAGWGAHEAATKALPEFYAPLVPSNDKQRAENLMLYAETVWQAWPIKKARGAAIPAIKKALKTRGSDLLNDVQAYANAIKTWPADEKKYVPMCSTWMNQERWLDDRSTWVKGAAAVGSQFSRVN